MQLILPKMKQGQPQGEQAPAPVQGKRKGTKKRVILILAAVVVVAAAAWGIKTLFFDEEEQIALTETTTYGSLATTIEGTGITLPADSVTVTTASTSEIEEVYVSAGDTVEVGDLLYVQDDSELDDQIEEYENSIADLEDELDTNQQQRSELLETLASLTVTAPFSGRIVEVSVEEGDDVMSGAVLAQLVDDSKMTITQYFSYAYEDQIYVGMQASLSIPSLMRSFTGTVTDIQKVERVTTEGTRCFAVTVTVDNPGALAEGMTGAGYLISDTGESIYPAVEGALEYYDSQTLTAQASGELTSVAVVDYQRVSAGEALFTVDGSDYQTQLESVERKITQAQERIATYEEQIAQVEESRGDYAVTAEISGKVIMVSVKEGESPRQAGQTAVTIYNMDSMTITANIDELDIDSIQMGMEVDIIQSGAEQDTHYTGTVTEISYEATNSNGVAYFPITITIPSQGAISAGVNVSYIISVGDAEEGVLAPIAALKNTSEGTCLFVKADTRPDNAVDLEDGTVPDGFYAVPVEVGVSNSQYVRILSGVEEGVEVFTRYQQSAPSGGESTSTDGTQGGDSFGGPGDFGGGQMPDFGGGMPGGGMGGMGGGPMG
jgi:HlyD family secretion protein